MCLTKQLKQQFQLRHLIGQAVSDEGETDDVVTPSELWINVYQLSQLTWILLFDGERYILPSSQCLACSQVFFHECVRSYT